MACPGGAILLVVNTKVNLHFIQKRLRLDLCLLENNFNAINMVGLSARSYQVVKKLFCVRNRHIYMDKAKRVSNNLQKLVVVIVLSWCYRVR